MHEWWRCWMQKSADAGLNPSLGSYLGNYPPFYLPWPHLKKKLKKNLSLRMVDLVSAPLDETKSCIPSSCYFVQNCLWNLQVIPPTWPPSVTCYFSVLSGVHTDRNKINGTIWLFAEYNSVYRTCVNFQVLKVDFFFLILYKLITEICRDGSTEYSASHLQWVRQINMSLVLWT